MPKDTSIESVLVIGSGPIVIGQACEFDYSGVQACRVLKEEGIRVILINSNPATIMTDPEFADATYIEPITPEFIEKIMEIERPTAVLATLGGQTALNAAMALHERGSFEKYGVRLIGANVDAIKRGEDREIFKTIVEKVGGESARSRICHSMAECLAAAVELNYPVVVRPSFTMGGLGSGIAFNQEELELIVKGRDYVTGLPRSVKISTNEIVRAIDDELLKIIDAIKEVLQQTLPELASDIIDNGIVMTGGSSMLRNLTDLVYRKTGVKAVVADEALYCVAKGIGIALDHMDTYNRALLAKK